MSHHSSSCLARSMPSGCLRFELQRQLRGVERPEELAAVDARDVVLERADEAQAVGRRVALDVHDGGAVVGEGLRRDRPDADPGEVGELDALERQPSRRRLGRPRAGRRRSAAPARRAPRRCARRSSAPGGSTRSASPDALTNAPGGAQRRARSASAQLVPVVAGGEVLERQHVGDRVHRRERDAAGDAALEELLLASARVVNATIFSRTSSSGMHERRRP